MSRRLYTGLIILAMSTLLLAACNQESKPTPAAAPAQTAEVVQQEEQQSALLDTAWTVQSYGGTDPVPAVPDSNPTVNYLGTRYVGYTGCNFYLGTYGVDDSTLRMKTPAVTRGICENDALFRQEETFLALLAETTSYEIDGENLILYSIDTQVMTLEPAEPVPFEGTTWNHKFLGTGQAVWLPIIPGTSITAEFEGDTVAGSAGCNDYTGTVTRDGNQITISDVVATEKMCTEPEGVMEQEQRYLEGLQTTGSIREYARSFELFDTEKQPLMLFNAD